MKTTGTSMLRQLRALFLFFAVAMATDASADTALSGCLARYTQAECECFRKELVPADWLIFGKLKQAEAAGTDQSRLDYLLSAELDSNAGKVMNFARGVSLATEKCSKPVEVNPVEVSKLLAAPFDSWRAKYKLPPKEIALNNTIEFALNVRSGKADASSKGVPSDTLGAVVERDVDLSSIVSAQLSGPGLEIRSLTPAARQKMSDKLPSEWRWELTATNKGQHKLLLEIVTYKSGSLEGIVAFRSEFVVNVP